MGIKPFLAIFGTHMRATNSQSNLIVMNAAETTVAIYKMQYYINVISSQGDPTPSAWIDVGIDFPFPRRAQPAVSDDSKFVCTGYNVSGGALKTGISYDLTDVKAVHTRIFNWKKQF